MRARQVYAALVVFVTLVAVGVLNVLYTQHVDRQADERNVERSREICGIIVLIDDRNQKIASPSSDQKVFIDELHRYRLKLGC